MIPDPDIIDVLIAGAGPSGLMMACLLAAQHINFRIIDRKKSFTDYSGALLIHSRTMEIFDQLGIASNLIEKATVLNGINFIFENKKPLLLDLRDSGNSLTKFPQILMLKQSETESILNDFLNSHGYHVERGIEFDTVNTGTDFNTSHIRLQNDHAEIIRSKFLVAADGGHSKIRKQLNIPFKGRSYPVSLFTMDSKLISPWRQNELYFLFRKEITIGFFPLQNNDWRIDGSFQKGFRDSNAIVFNNVQQKLAEIKIHVPSPFWFSNYNLNQRYAECFEKENCYLIGDAAHVHSPFGAQGMNTGIQDAYNLAWKLAFKINANSNPVLLKTYEEERKSNSKKLIRWTLRPFLLATSKNIFYRMLRIYFLPPVFKILFYIFRKSEKFRIRIFKFLSEIEINYKTSSLSRNASFGKFNGKATKPGMRLPHIIYNEKGQEIFIQEKVRYKSFLLLIFSKDESAEKILNVVSKYRNFINSEIIYYSPATQKLFDFFGIKDNGFYLIRPDLYIACRSNKLNITDFENYISRFFI